MVMLAAQVQGLRFHPTPGRIHEHFCLCRVEKLLFTGKPHIIHFVRV